MGQPTVEYTALHGSIHMRCCATGKLAQRPQWGGGFARVPTTTTRTAVGLDGGMALHRNLIPRMGFPCQWVVLVDGRRRRGVYGCLAGCLAVYGLPPAGKRRTAGCRPPRSTQRPHPRPTRAPFSRPRPLTGPRWLQARLDGVDPRCAANGRPRDPT